MSRRELIQRSTITAGALILADKPANAGSSKPIGIEIEAAPLPDGVKAVWDLKKAHSEKTLTRERVCLNGLWRWQPVAELSNTPPASGWGWFKAPGCWPGISDYLQKDCQTVFPHDSWKNTNLHDTSLAWYQREITIPADWKGRRISLGIEYLNTFATVFVDSTKAGELRFPAGDLDLSAFCHPGQSHLISILVQAAPLKAVMLSYTDTNGAREVKGSVERRGLCGDVWLTSLPKSARITDLKISTFVIRGEIEFDVALESLEPGVTYSIQPRVTEANKVVHQGVARSFTATDLKNGRIMVTEAWKAEKLWDIHTPQNQYSAELLLAAPSGLIDHTQPVRFGYREFTIKGKDFYLNGTRIYLPSVPLDSAQVGAAWASYDGARETLERYKSMGMYFLYTHNYSCEPGVHLSFTEILRAADDVGMLISLAQPHFSNYDWKAPGADDHNGYAVHAEWYVRVAQNHPSVVCYAMSHNATGYVEEANPDMIDGIQDPREDWGRRNSILALRAEAIVKRFDTSRIVYHHSSGNLGSMHTCNFYVNFVPQQELCDWFEHWETKGVKPVYLCEYGCPCTWDWTMYRGWYKGKREWGSAVVPWEFCIAEWNAQFVGESAYKIGEREKANLRWEAAQFKAGRDGWHRWDYPTQVGNAGFPDTNMVFHDYVTDNWRAYRTRGVSGFGPWEYEMYWTLKGNADRSRKQLPVDWENLQRPGFSADYVEDRPTNIALGFDRSDWLPTPAGAALLRNNMPLLAYIGGSSSAVTGKEHNYLPGQTFEKQLIIINNSRVTAECDCSWELESSASVAYTERVTVAAGQQKHIPIRIQIVENTTPGKHTLSATVRFNGAEIQKDTFDIHVGAPPARLSSTAKIALFDPHGDTSKDLNGKVAVKVVNAGDDLAGFDVLIIGKAALTRDGLCPNLSRVKDGLKVVMMEQTPETLEQRFGFRTAAYGLRQVFRRLPDHPALAGLDNDQLQDWRGEATTLPPRLNYTIADRSSPQVKWCGIDVTRVWRCGCRGNVASALIEKPAAGDFTPIVDGGYGLQYSPLMEYREGKGMILFCQMDISGRTESDPAAELLRHNILQYVSEWKPAPQREVFYVGEDAGRAHFASAGFGLQSLPNGKMPKDAVLIAARGSDKEVTEHKSEVQDWLKSGGRMLAIGVDGPTAGHFVPASVRLTEGEHISTYFEPPARGSWLAGVCPADVHNRDPREVPLVTAGATIVGNGVLAKSESPNVVFCQLAPWNFSSASPMNQKRTFRHISFLTSRLAANLGAKCSTKLLENIDTPAKPEEKRWLDGLYLDQPEEWDDPYRFFGW